MSSVDRNSQGRRGIWDFGLGELLCFALLLILETEAHSLKGSMVLYATTIAIAMVYLASGSHLTEPIKPNGLIAVYTRSLDAKQRHYSEPYLAPQARLPVLQLVCIFHVWV